jgi:hypothetical protein
LAGPKKQLRQLLKKYIKMKLEKKKNEIKKYKRIERNKEIKALFVHMNYKIILCF